MTAQASGAAPSRLAGSRVRDLGAWLSDEANAGRRADPPRWPLGVLAAAMVVAAALILYLGRRTGPTPDEVSFFVTTPSFSVREAIDPYGGHLILTTRAVYRALLEIFGSDYVTFRILAAATVLTTVGLFYAFASRTIGRVAALAPCFVLLVFGSDTVHVLAGNSFTVLLPIACGIGALLAIERGDRLGDVAACALLVLATVTYSTGLALIVAIAVAILLRPDRRRRMWVAVLPVALYVAWWAWSQTLPDQGGGIVSSNVLLIPAWSFDSLAAVLGSTVGLNHRFAGSPAPLQAGPPLALAALAALLWRARTGSLPRAVWPAVAAVTALWALQCLAATDADNYPSSPHYMFPGALLVLLVAVQAARGLRWSPAALVLLFAVAAVGVATNTALLRTNAAGSRTEAAQTKATLTGLDLAGRSANPDFVFRGVKVNPLLAYALANANHPTADYLTASGRYGALGTSPSPDPTITDSVLVAALGLRLERPTSEVGSEGCVRVGARRPGPVSFPLAPGSTVVVKGASGAVTVRRFSGVATVPIGTASPAQPVMIRLPRDRAPDRPWQLSTAGRSVRVCPAG